MARDYGKISTSIWNSRKFRSLKSIEARHVYLYLHTCPHVNSTGCFVLPEGYAMADLGMDQTAYRQAVDSLCTALLIACDHSENLVRIIDFLTHDPFTNPSHASGAIRLVSKLPDCEQKTLLFNDIATRRYAENNPDLQHYFDALSTPCRDPLPEPLPEPLPKEEKREPIGSPKKPSRKCRLPDGWVPSDRNISDAQAKNFSFEEIQNEAARFRDHHAAKDTTFANWDAGWRTWIGNARKFAAGSRLAIGAASGRNGQGGSIASIVARRRAAGEV